MESNVEESQTNEETDLVHQSTDQIELNIQASEEEEFDGPPLVPEGANEAAVQKYKKSVNQYSKECYALVLDVNLEGERLWMEFVYVFRPRLFQYLDKTQLFNWITLLENGGIHVVHSRGQRRSTILTECFRRQRFIPSQAYLDKQRRQSNAERVNRTEEAPVISSPNLTSDAAGDNNGMNSNASGLRHHEETRAHIAQNIGPSQRRNANVQPAQVAIHQQSSHVQNPSRLQTPVTQANVGLQTNTFGGNHHASSRHTRNSRNNMGISGLLKAYSGRQTFSGAITDDLNSILEEYETMCELCGLSDNEKATTLPLILRGNAITFYSTRFKSTPQQPRTDLSYDEVVQSFKDHYMSNEQKQRILMEWQTIRLSQLMNESPQQSEAEVFHKLSNKLIRLHRQLDSNYRADVFLRDQVIVSVDIPTITRALREKVPETSQEAINRVATFLSSEPNSAGANYTLNQYGEDIACYSLGNTYGGEARRTLRGTSSRNKGNGNSNQQPQRANRRLSSKWLAGVKGCWVCGGTHQAATKHSKEEIISAINKIRARVSSAMITVDDLALITSELTEPEGTEISQQEEKTDEIVYSDEENHITMYIKEDEFETHKADEQYLADAALIHGRSYASDLKNELAVMHAELSIGEESQFKGIHLDTCANRSSVMSLNQYKAYCEEFRVPCQIDRTNRTRLQGIGGSSNPIGTAKVPVPFRDLKLVIDVDFKIVPDNVPSLLSNRDMIENGLDISLQDKVVKFGNRSQSLLLENYFFIHRWNPTEISYSMYTEVELRQLHRSFGHPSVTALCNLLKRANPDDFSQSVREQIDELTKQCIICKENASKPKRFKITVGSSDLRFNHIVAVDIMFIQNRPILHIVDEATHFCAALFLKTHKSKDVWQAVLQSWIRMYLGPPDFLRVDQGSNFVSKEFLDSADGQGITVLPAPIESPATMTHVERYHAPLRAAYLKIRADLPRSETDKDCLQMAVKSVNDTIGPEGLCPTLLVFGAIPRLASRQPAASQLARAQAIDKAMDAVHKEQSKRRVAFGLKKICHPIANESSDSLRQLPAGSHVLVYRNKSKKWEGPYPFIHLQGETAVVQLPTGRKIFRSHVVKPLTESSFTDATSIPGTANEKDQALVANQKQGTISNRMKVHVSNIQDHDFMESRRMELDGLIGRGVFEIIPKSTVPNGMRVYGTRWVDEIKTVNGIKINKSRLIAQNYKDKEATALATKSPTISRLGKRLAVQLAAIFPRHISYIRDISQAYVQSESNLDREVYLRPPPELNLPSDIILQAVRPLYGIPESGLHWFKTYHTHHKEALNMVPTTFDPCFLYRKGNSAADGICILQVDDSYGHGVESFLENEDAKSKKFKTKPRKLLKEGSTTDFNGCQLSVLSNNSYRLHQSDKLSSLRQASTREQLASIRAQVAYIGQCTRPDLCASVQLLASHVRDPTEVTYKKLKACVNRAKNTQNIGLTYRHLDINTLRIVLFTDASFANTDNYKSQIGFVVVLADDTNAANIVHYGSSRCKRVTRSVMAAEIHALSYGFDNAYVTKHMLEEVLKKEIPLDVYIDSKTVFNVVAKHGSTNEKRLQIDVFALREAHESKTLRSLSWISGDTNVADGLTKGLVLDAHPLWKLMTMNQLDLLPKGWVKPIQQ